MKVKKYSASTMSEAMKKVRSELGENAVILNSKVTYIGGFMGLFKKKMIEVIAAIDPDVENEKMEISRVKTKTASKSIIQPANEKKENYESNSSVEAELKELKQMITTLKSKNRFETFTEGVQDILFHLMNHDVSDSTLFQLGDQLEKKIQAGTLPVDRRDEWATREVKHFLHHHLKGIEYGGISYKRKYINVIGPTGVGKTTTLAKMAAEAVIERRMKIAFITTDTYRIAAIEQLKTYAGLLNVPVEVVYKIEDFKKAIDKFMDYDHVFIDTAGRNFREKKYVEDLQKVIDFDHQMETYLVLSLTSKEKDMREIISQFSSIHIDRFIFTKLDETSSYGSMINMMSEAGIGAAYVTNGQDVPEDITEVNEDEIVRLLMKGFCHERSSV
ncbi:MULTISPECIES: flagellar biosynthesis protein FlhF [Bacillaceae]|uniref:flagellar biosynthesis protein FlhF n=1 Tax=Bacillaceae TaxID=186817 RepID=UPI001C5645B9|nr:flagellar biosynthesis protein FlhF [Rossellomorea sp. YZS02]MBW3113853.1 flagellar biosynthesis protein FlhF [Bacillus sp. MCCB 382]MDX8343904.1 flagellar biosynthesis protein FlhF [Rossellomorea sp. YZS02]